MAAETGTLAFKPPHPGEVLREDILPAISMTRAKLAERLGVSKQTISKLLREVASVSTDMALRLGAAFQNGARFWLALQMQHDLWIAERNNKTKVEPIIWDAA